MLSFCKDAIFVNGISSKKNLQREKLPNYSPPLMFCSPS